MSKEGPTPEEPQRSSPTPDSLSDNASGKPQKVAARDDSSCVQVAVRVRPVLALEGDDENICMEVQRIPGADYATTIQVGGGPRFSFDQVFGVHTTQQQLYTDRVAPLVVSCLEGYNATILAYGQTGSGVSWL
jgi:Kinesin motor domain